MLKHTKDIYLIILQLLRYVKTKPALIIYKYKLTILNDTYSITFLCHSASCLPLTLPLPLYSYKVTLPNSYGTNYLPFFLVLRKRTCHCTSYSMTSAPKHPQLPPGVLRRNYRDKLFVLPRQNRI